MIVFALLLAAACTLFASAQTKPVVLVAPFKAIANMGMEDADFLTSVFMHWLANTGKVKLVDRGVMERVLRESQFQTGDWTGNEKMAELGKEMNADWIVLSELRNFRSNILIRVSFFDIAARAVKGSAEMRFAGMAEAYEKMDTLVDALVRYTAGL